MERNRRSCRSMAGVELGLPNSGPLPQMPKAQHIKTTEQPVNIIQMHDMASLHHLQTRSHRFGSQHVHTEFGCDPKGRQRVQQCCLWKLVLKLGGLDRFGCNAIKLPLHNADCPLVRIPYWDFVSDRVWLFIQPLSCAEALPKAPWLLHKR